MYVGSQNLTLSYVIRTCDGANWERLVREYCSALPCPTCAHTGIQQFTIQYHVKQVCPHNNIHAHKISWALRKYSEMGRMQTEPGGPIFYHYDSPATVFNMAFDWMAPQRVQTITYEYKRIVKSTILSSIHECKPLHDIENGLGTTSSTNFGTTYLLQKLYKMKTVQLKLEVPQTEYIEFQLTQSHEKDQLHIQKWIFHHWWAFFWRDKLCTFVAQSAVIKYKNTYIGQPYSRKQSRCRVTKSYCYIFIKEEIPAMNWTPSPCWYIEWSPNLGSRQASEKNHTCQSVVPASWVLSSNQSLDSNSSGRSATRHRMHAEWETAHHIPDESLVNGLAGYFWFLVASTQDAVARKIMSGLTCSTKHGDVHNGSNQKSLTHKSRFCYTPLLEMASRNSLKNSTPAESPHYPVLA